MWFITNIENVTLHYIKHLKFYTSIFEDPYTHVPGISAHNVLHLIYLQLYST